MGVMLFALQRGTFSGILELRINRRVYTVVEQRTVYTVVNVSGLWSGPLRGKTACWI